ncbi:hypothetical protein GCM10022252_62970 [Streptosporangium oxazolinicum]|uniref:Uncharacterized protein n=1 Tax=Streptosporangium oxazolinicum TaxID=909287 RepID=A0ABP8BE98_9ACTN
MAVRGVLVPGLAHDELQRYFSFAEVGGGAVAQLVQIEPGVLLQQDTGAVVAEAGAAGVRADVGVPLTSVSWAAKPGDRRSIIKARANRQRERRDVSADTGALSDPVRGRARGA